MANMIRYCPFKITSEIITSCNGLLLLIRLTCSGWEHIVGDTIPSSSFVNCSREGVLALANFALVSNDKMWRTLLSSKCVTAFSAVITGALLELNKDSTVDTSTKMKLKVGKGMAPVSSESESMADKQWNDSFQTLEAGVEALSRVMEVSPLSFAKEISATPLMQQLQKIFKMNVLPSSLRTNTAFILYSMTCARDAEASKLIQDGLTRTAIKEIMQEHELTLNPGGDRYPWTLEQLFAYVSRGLVAWASQVALDMRGKCGIGRTVDKSNLLFTCPVRVPSSHTTRPHLSPYHWTASVFKSVEITENVGDDDIIAEPPSTFTFDALSL